MRRFAVAASAALSVTAYAPADPAAAREDVAWTADASGPGRFIGVHGRRSSILGYPQTGLEIWAYPLQLLSGYQLRFREAGRTEPWNGATLLTRIESRPSEVVRVYSGPDFVVREHLFTPLSAPGAIVTYEVEGRPDIQIEARFQPSLDLMWPGALGGQEIAWSDARSGYVEREPLHGYAATIRSGQAIAHDATTNVATGRPATLGLVIAPKSDADGIRRARLTVTQDEGGDPAGASLALDRNSAALADAATAHYAAVRDEAVEIVTPDAEVNRALAAATTDVEQAWVCAPGIGCGMVGGYGPSRPGRRPQYAWFFAGDGLVAVQGLLAAGRYERARDELAFVLQYQNAANGMIWHEISTSAPLIDWQRRYPYMFVHVDITLQFLSTLSAYVETTGDTAFLKAHWRAVRSAWRYARSLIDPHTGLPTIPAGKEGQNEQTVLHDDVRLSAAWIAAADGFAQLARTVGDRGGAREGQLALRLARQAVRDTYWDAASGFWYGGHDAAGQAVREQRPDALGLLEAGVFTPAQADQALERLATPDFQTDWGMRSLSARDPHYDPNTYADGAVWGLGSSAAATSFWRSHRPFTAWDAWHGMVAWAALDSPGHMHEVLAGDLFHSERESVPEQTWTSAGFLAGAVDGLLGLQVRGRERRVTLAPHLPADWSQVNVTRVRVGDTRLSFRLSQDGQAATLEVDNPGPPVTIDWQPEIPLGASLTGAADGAAATLLHTAQDQHARLIVVAGERTTWATVRYRGGVRIAPVEVTPRIGDHSVNPKLVSARWDAGERLRLRAYVVDPAHAAIDLFTAMPIRRVTGGAVTGCAAGRCRLVLHAPTQGDDQPVDVEVAFAGDGTGP